LINSFALQKIKYKRLSRKGWSLLFLHCLYTGKRIIEEFASDHCSFSNIQCSISVH